MIPRECKRIAEADFPIAEMSQHATPSLRGPDVLGDLPAVASLPEPTSWLNEHALTPFIDEVRTERIAETDRVAEHVELSLTEVLQRIDDEIGRANDELEHDVTGADGRLAQAESRHAEVLARRKRREELGRQRAVTLQGVERLASGLVLPHPERETLDVRRLRPHPETEMTAMRIVMEHEATRGCQVYDVHEKNLGYDVTSLDLQSGQSAPDRGEGTRRSARFPWHEVTKVAHYYLSVNALRQPMEIRETNRGYNTGPGP